MNIKEFAEKACNDIAKILRKEVKCKEVDKLNGAKRYGLMILEPGGNIAPTLYLDEFYHMYLHTENWRETITQIIVTYLSDSFPSSIDMEWFKDFGRVQGLIFYKLINFDANTALLEQVPHTRYLDFAIVYCVHYENEEFGNGSILIHNSHLEMWDCTTQELASLAEKNTPQLYPLAVSTMKDILQECMDDMEELPPTEDTPAPMYIMTNEARVNGAITILYKDALKDFAASIHSDVAILPSSVHEVILLPMREEKYFNELRDMVCEVNRNELSKEDFLSDNVYLYRRSTDNIQII